jgi:hypothetical protein
MASALQPLSMMSTLLEKRLQNPNPDIAALTRNSSQLNTAAREASSACMGAMTWLAPDANAFVTVTAGMEEATGLVMSALSFSGFTIVNRVGAVPVKVPRSLTRNLVLAALFALTDAVKAPANVVFDAQVEGNALVLIISIEPMQGEPLTSGAPSYRKLEWEDVQALAELESANLTYAAHSVKLRFPVTVEQVQSQRS